MMKVFFVALFNLLLFGAAFSVDAQVRKNSATALPRQLNELNRNFTYRGKKVNPLGIKELISWTGGAPFPGATALAVAGTFDSDRYFGDYRTGVEGLVSVELDEGSIQRAWFGYKNLGRLANGYHVLRVFDCSGGTATFESLLLVEATIDYEYEDRGARRDLLVLKRRGEFNLGDRYEGEIEVLSRRNTIIVGADPAHGRPPGDLVKRTVIKIP